MRVRLDSEDETEENESVLSGPCRPTLAESSRVDGDGILVPFCPRVTQLTPRNTGDLARCQFA